MDIPALVRAQKDYFRTGATLEIPFRRRALDTLERAVTDREGELLSALAGDLGKSPTEAYLCEMGLVRSELGYVKRRFPRWARPRRAATPLSQFPAKSFTLPRPYGVCLVMSPWNYPLLLSLDPLIGAIAAGNCCVVKPSAYAPHTSAALEGLIRDCFPRSTWRPPPGAVRKTRLFWTSPLTTSFLPAGPRWAARSWRRPPSA